MSDITKELFDAVQEKLEKDGYLCGSSHPFWIIYNSQSEILDAIKIAEKVLKYGKLFPYNELLKDLVK